MTELTDSLEAALTRIEDFQAVQRTASEDELREAVELLQESVGIGDYTRAVIRDHLGRISGSDRAPGHLLLGVIVGLMAAELRADGDAEPVGSA